MLLADNNPDTNPITNESICILRHCTNPSLHTVYASPGLKDRNIQNDFKMIAYALDSKEKNHPFLWVQEQVLKAALPISIPKFLDHAKVLAIFRQMAQGEAERIYTSKLQESMPKIQK